MVWFQLGLSIGSRAESPEQAGLANLTAEMLLRGTQNLQRETFEEILEGYGASVGAGVGTDSITISGSSLSEHWPKVAKLIAEALAEPAFRADEFTSLVDEIKADIIEERNSDSSLGKRFYNKELWGDHPYGRPILGTLESLDRITLADVKSFYADWFSTQDAVVGLLGDFDAGAMDDLQNLIDALPRHRAALELVPLPAAPRGRRIVLVDKPERSQVQLFMGHLFLRPEGADYAAAWTANEAFGGHGFGARMMQEVREKRGWSYGAYGSIQHRKQASSYTLWVFPAVDDAIPCLQLVLDLYEGFKAEGISEDEFDYARSSIVNSSAFYRDTPSKRLSYEVRKQTTGYDPASLVSIVEGLSHEAVQTAAGSAFDPDNLVAVLVGTADSKVKVGEGDGAREVTLVEALREIFGADAVEVVPFDS
jgi:zinc protease